MKAKFRTALFTALAMGVSSSAWATNICFTPHIGADYKFWQVEPKKTDFTRDYVSVFPDITRAGTLYVGTRINKVWGIDIGYDRSSQKDKWRGYDSPDVIFGQPAVIGDASQVDVRLTAWYISGLFYWEVYDNVEIVFHAGLSSLQTKSSIIYYPVGADPVDLRFKTESKASARFGFGMQYLFLKHFGARAMVTFDQTSRINYIGSNQNNSPFDIHPYKNATSWSFGLFAEFRGV